MRELLYFKYVCRKLLNLQGDSEKSDYDRINFCNSNNNFIIDNIDDRTDSLENNKIRTSASNSFFELCILFLSKSHAVLM